MKRDRADDGYGAGAKRSRNDSYNSGKTDIRLLIQSKCAGGVIGKGGENIRRIRSQHNAQLTVPDSNSPERIITISADLDDALSCVADVLPKLEDSKRPSDEMDLRMLVHQSHAGAIIGRAGFKIKELREQTNTNLKVFSQCCPMSTDRVLQINGELDKIIDAIRAVLALLADIPVKGTNKPYDTINYDPGFVQDYGGFNPDRGYRGGGGPPRGYGGPPPRGGGGGDGGGGGRYGRGPPPGGRGSGYGGPPMDYGGRPPRGGGADYRGGGGGGGPPGPPPPPMNFGPSGGPVQTTQVTVPSELGGTIIGRGGERINRIREDSGAHIVMDPPAQGNPERIITISGTQNQIQMAQYLLQQCVRSSVAGRKYIQDQQSR